MTSDGASFLLFDSAVKGTALLLVAGAAAVVLKRDSAATRHLVWLVAIVGLLLTPLLSALLPGWRVLPAWADISATTVAADASASPEISPADRAVELPRDFQSEVNEKPVAAPPITLEPAVSSWKWMDLLPAVWAIGFWVLVLRLAAARWMLWNCERRATSATGEPIAAAADFVRGEMEIDRPIRLLVHPEKTIPVVWGVFRPCLLLPVGAREWSGEQLRSVLLHELAHIKRYDTLAQLLAQVACAVHWFNPLVWVAAWRLGVERERACDDLVLASGVRPSAYAGRKLESPRRVAGFGRSRTGDGGWRRRTDRDAASGG
jgi:beta-lactamase regulating signal transducer with metallopeptidase domain